MLCGFRFPASSLLPVIPEACGNMSATISWLTFAICIPTKTCPFHCMHFHLKLLDYCHGTGKSEYPRKKGERIDDSGVLINERDVVPLAEIGGKR